MREIAVNRRAGRFAFVLVLALVCLQAPLAIALSALERPAVQLRAPARSFTQAAASAGQRLVAVGERGIVILSDDRGSTWRQARAVPVSVTLTAVHFVDERQGWAVGHGGVILHTQDGGESWALQADGRGLAKLAEEGAQRLLTSDPQNIIASRELKAAQLLVSDGPDKPLLDVFFRDAQHGWVVGAYNLFFETRDGGKTWASAMTRLDNPKAFHLYAIRAQGRQVFVAGEQGQMHRSVDAGQTFLPLSSPYKGSWFTLSIEPAGGVLVAGLRGNAFYSADQGATWQAIVGAPPVSFVSSALRADGSVVLGNQAGQLFTTRAGAPLSPLKTPAMPPLAGLLDLGPSGLLVTGAGGPIPVPVQAGTKP